MSHLSKELSSLITESSELMKNYPLGDAASRDPSATAALLISMTAATFTA